MQVTLCLTFLCLLVTLLVQADGLCRGDNCRLNLKRRPITITGRLLRYFLQREINMIHPEASSQQLKRKKMRKKRRRTYRKRKKANPIKTTTVVSSFNYDFGDANLVYE
jgi:hypothetical protein